MDLGLKGKIVLITGGSKGLGLACAHAFLAEGARVAIASRSHDNLQKARAELGTVETFAADLCQPRAAADLVEALERRVGPVDVLVNSAGAARRVGAEELTPEAWRAAMDAKYFSYINVIDPLIKRMAGRGRGAIVNVIGSGGKVATPTHIGGGAANAALMLATAGLANAYAGRGVRVIGINPGPTKTERVAHGLVADARRDGVSEEEALKRMVSRMPMKRMPEPHEIADIVVFAASERAKFLTGAILSADAATNPTVV
jgi:NAD(P)-dependent dehydrogenase (short-subunit alcohol dehydrogenase family)